MDNFISRTFKAQSALFFPLFCPFSLTLWSSRFLLSWIKSRAGPMTFLATLIILKRSFNCFFHFRSFSPFLIECLLIFHIQTSWNIIIFQYIFSCFYMYLHQSQYSILAKMSYGESFKLHSKYSL